MPDPNSDLIVFTDLDGTLLDHFTYDFSAALPAIHRLNDMAIPWIINTSKTFAEVIDLHHALGNQHPFITENGAAIFLTKNCYRQWIEQGCIQAWVAKPHKSHSEWVQITLGKSRDQMQAFLDDARESYQFNCLTALSDAEVMALTGLSLLQARQAKDREFSEPLIWQDSEEALEDFTLRAQAETLKVQRGGRFVHLMGQSDKGVALAVITAIYQKQASVKPLTRIALGDGENDIPMLLQADIAVFITSPTHATPAYPAKFAPAQTILISSQHGPEGWNNTLLEILDDYRPKAIDAVISRPDDQNQKRRLADG